MNCRAVADAVDSLADTKGPCECRRRQRSLEEVFAEAAEHLPAVPVDFLGGRTGAILGQQVVGRFLGFESCPGPFVSQLAEPRLEAQAPRRRFRFRSEE